MHDRWTTGIAPLSGAGNVYANLVDAYVGLFPTVPDVVLDTAREACRLLARSIVCADRVVDADVIPCAQAENVLAAQVCQLEGVRLLQSILPPMHTFWAELSGRLREFADAALADSTAERERVIDVASAERIALGKNALARIVAPLVCTLGNSSELQPSLDAATTRLIVAVQALDDAIDWRSDLAAHRLSLITARIWSNAGELIGAQDVERFVLGIAMQQVLEQGYAALREARAISVLHRSLQWQELTGKIVAGYDRALEVFRVRELSSSPTISAENLAD